HDIQLLLVVDYFQWLASCFGNSYSNDPPYCKYYICQYKVHISSTSFLPSVLLLAIVVAIVGVAVVVVAAGAVVESSFVYGVPVGILGHLPLSQLKLLEAEFDARVHEFFYVFLVMSFHIIDDFCQFRDSVAELRRSLVGSICFLLEFSDLTFDVFSIVQNRSGGISLNNLGYPEFALHDKSFWEKELLSFRGYDNWRKGLVTFLYRMACKAFHVWIIGKINEGSVKLAGHFQMELEATRHRIAICQGFEAVLAVLVTEASQSRQHGKSESDSYYLSD
ncbi:hypothetical protein Tco_0129145, partial [Tanacetum coccineum]